ncbi:MAG: M20/M25/M40 family metallo-hydrolase [Candidatus Lokiarchaeota archaeon]|nr:M20/M25/M40 family metallo-hydrolase [Candidatus Harpocratesius repetitus]
MVDISKLDLKLLERLTNAFGPSGWETEVQKIVRDYAAPYVDEILFDRTGSVILRKGNSGPKLMMAGHADEIGLIVSSIEKNGYLKVSNIGGIVGPWMLGTQIRIRPLSGSEDVIGIVQIGFPKSKDDIQKMAKLEAYHVDIGCSSAEEVEALGIQVGDLAVPYTSYRQFTRMKKKGKKDKSINNDDMKSEKKDEMIPVPLAVAKAFDDRIGVFIILEVLRRIKEENLVHPNTVYFVSTAQEEVGVRGARTAAQMLNPDIGFSLDVTLAGDVPGTNAPQKMGDGVAISTFDSSMIPNPKMRRFVTNLAKEKEIKYKNAFLKFGGTDAGAIHLTGFGVPSLFLGVPTRYVHSAHSQLNLEDVEYTIRLLIEIIRSFDDKTVSSFTTLE